MHECVCMTISEIMSEHMGDLKSFSAFISSLNETLVTHSVY